MYEAHLPELREVVARLLGVRHRVVVGQFREITEDCGVGADRAGQAEGRAVAAVLRVPGLASRTAMSSVVVQFLRTTKSVDAIVERVVTDLADNTDQLAGLDGAARFSERAS